MADKFVVWRATLDKEGHYVYAIALSQTLYLPPPRVSGTVSGNFGMLRMSSQAKSSLAGHRLRMAHRGFVRVEVTVSKDDASLVRHVAAALSDPARQAAARILLRQRFVEPSNVSLKTLLAAAPLDGIDLDRGTDLGRDVDL